MKWHGGTLGTVEGREKVAGLVSAIVSALPDLRNLGQDIIAERDIRLFGEGCAQPWVLDSRVALDRTGHGHFHPRQWDRLFHIDPDGKHDRDAHRNIYASSHRDRQPQPGRRSA